MKPLLIIKAGEKLPSLAAVPGDFEDWIAAGLGPAAPPVEVAAVYRGEALPAVASLSGVLITGSAAMVTDPLPWIEHSAAWLRGALAAGLPVLGICFGHQLLAHALGGRVDYNPRGVEVGTLEITCQAPEDPLFAGLGAHFPAQLSHRQAVLQLPPGARPLAASELDPHQAFAYGERAWGLQFHPEFDAPVVRAYVAYYRELLQAQGRDAEALLEAVRPSPEAQSLLRRFTALL